MGDLERIYEGMWLDARHLILTLRDMQIKDKTYKYCLEEEELGGEYGCHC